MSSRYQIISLALTVALVSLCVRIVGIRDSGVTSDEELWLSRSGRIITRLESNPLKATSHLVHPGLTPSLVMASGQIVARKWNSLMGVSNGDPFFVTPLTACRVTNAFVSSLIAPVTFLGLILGLDLIPAFLASIFVALDPGLIGMARMAHLDSIMALLVTLTLTMYFYAVRFRSIPMKIGAGVMWGLAVLTKVTAVIIVPIFIVYRIVRMLWLRPPPDEEQGWVSWSDVWAILAGHFVMIGTYTRLWFHPSEFVLDYGVRSRVADAAFHAGVWLHHHYFFTILTLVALIVSALLLHKTNDFRWRAPCVHLSCLGGILVFIASVRPALIENLIRFWTWARSLSHKKDVVVGSTTVIEPPAHGYLDLMLASMPELVLLGAGIGLAIFLAQMYSRTRRDRLSLLTLFFLTIVLWLGILSISPKESWRYALPVVPLLAAFASMGLYETTQWGIGRIAMLSDRNTPPMTKYFAPNLRQWPFGILITVVLIVTSWGTFQWYPHYFLYRNSLSGGIHHIEARQPGFSTREVIEFLLNERARRGVEQLRISVFGSAFVHSALIKGRFFKAAHDHFIFANYSPEESHLRLEYRPGHRFHEYHEWDATLAQPPIYTYSFLGEPMIGVYNVVRNSPQAGTPLTKVRPEMQRSRDVLTSN